jgi:hypothetical protein
MLTPKVTQVRHIGPSPYAPVAVPGPSHAIAVSHPDATVHPNLEAAALRVAA